jgi:hypothetical protein
MYTDVLEAARLLPGEEQRRLAAELLKGPDGSRASDALAAVEATHGSMKLPDLETLRWLAEDKRL